MRRVKRMTSWERKKKVNEEKMEEMEGTRKK